MLPMVFRHALKQDAIPSTGRVTIGTFLGAAVAMKPWVFTDRGLFAILELCLVTDIMGQEEAAMIQAAIVGPLTDYEYETPEARHTHCMEAMRERFLDEVSTSDIRVIADEAELAGWNYREVQRALDALVAEKARQAGAEPC